MRKDNRILLDKLSKAVYKKIDYDVYIEAYNELIRILDASERRKILKRDIALFEDYLGEMETILYDKYLYIEDFLNSTEGKNLSFFAKIEQKISLRKYYNAMEDLRLFQYRFYSKFEGLLYADLEDDFQDDALGEDLTKNNKNN